MKTKLNKKIEFILWCIILTIAALTMAALCGALSTLGFGLSIIYSYGTIRYGLKHGWYKKI